VKKSEMVKEFHEAFDLPVGSSHFSNTVHVLYRMELLNEEMREAYEAIAKNDPEEFLDALVDLMYFIYGTALVFNYDIDEAFRRVHEANMHKLGPDGKVSYREDGKVLKPEGWVAPVLTDLVPPPPLVAVFNHEKEKL
jgi:predicted HAD superfamily Cof-like phosphohydrolase